MPDLVGVVIPNDIAALSSLAGVVVAIVALVTARRARTDARAAASESARTAERQRVTRDAVVGLAQLSAQATATTGASAASPEQTVVAPASTPRRRARVSTDEGEGRPSWARRAGSAKAVRPRHVSPDEEASSDDLQRRIADVLRRVTDDG